MDELCCNHLSPLNFLLIPFFLYTAHIAAEAPPETPQLALRLSNAPTLDAYVSQIERSEPALNTEKLGTNMVTALLLRSLSQSVTERKKGFFSKRTVPALNHDRPNLPSATAMLWSVMGERLNRSALDRSDASVQRNQSVIEHVTSGSDETEQIIGEDTTPLRIVTLALLDVPPLGYKQFLQSLKDPQKKEAYAVAFQAWQQCRVINSQISEDRRSPYARNAETYFQIQQRLWRFCEYMRMFSLSHEVEEWLRNYHAAHGFPRQVMLAA